MRIFKKGFKKAVEMLEKGEENFRGVFVWAPRLKNWLKDQDYVFWVGTNISFKKKSLPKEPIFFSFSTGFLFS